MTNLTRDDLFEIVCLCHAALAQDSPNPSSFYINQIMNYAYADLTSHQKKELEVYLAEKKYLPPLKLARPNEAESNKAANIILND